MYLKSIFVVVFIVCTSLRPVFAGTGRLDLTRDGDGDGLVANLVSGEAMSVIPGYAWGSDACLEAVPAPGSRFDGWSGDCTGTDPICLKLALEEYPEFKMTVRFEKDASQLQTATFYPKNVSVGFFSVPDSGNPLRKQLLGLIRTPIEERLGHSVVFVVKALPVTETAALAYLHTQDKAGHLADERSMACSYVKQKAGHSKRGHKIRNDVDSWPRNNQDCDAHQYDALKVAVAVGPKNRRLCC